MRGDFVYGAVGMEEPHETQKQQAPPAALQQATAAAESLNRLSNRGPTSNAAGMWRPGYPPVLHQSRPCGISIGEGRAVPIQKEAVQQQPYKLRGFENLDCLNA